MPVHDWTRVDAGLFHHFHEQWVASLCNVLNGGRLPPGFVALLDQVPGGPIPDVVALSRRPRTSPDSRPDGGVAVATSPPQARFVFEFEEDTYARRTNRIKIQHRHGKVVAIVETVSPGNKNNRHGILSFVQKVTELIRQGVNILVVDIFPPSERDPQGIHQLIADELAARPFELPADKPLTIASYRTAPILTAYVDTIAVGDVFPATPLFLSPDTYVPAPLEESYAVSWAVFPEDFRDLLEPPAA